MKAENNKKYTKKEILKACSDLYKDEEEYNFAVALFFGTYRVGFDLPNDLIDQIELNREIFKRKIRQFLNNESRD